MIKLTLSMMVTVLHLCVYAIALSICIAVFLFTAVFAVPFILLVSFIILVEDAIHKPDSQ